MPTPKNNWHAVECACPVCNHVTLINRDGDNSLTVWAYCAACGRMLRIHGDAGRDVEIKVF
jgi:hypothetical protein